MKGTRDGPHFLSQKTTKEKVKPFSEGGFSSKQGIECPAETGSKARTHRPSPSLNREASRNMVSVPEGVLE